MVDSEDPLGLRQLSALEMAESKPELRGKLFILQVLHDLMALAGTGIQGRSIKY